jgi:hypothetical protein
MLNQYTSSIAGTGGLLGNAGISTAPGVSGLGQVGQAAMLGSTLFNPTSGIGSWTF